METFVSSFVSCGRVSSRGVSSYLDEANVGSLLTEALTADVEAVLADQTGTVGADAAVVAHKDVSKTFFLRVSLDLVADCPFSSSEVPPLSQVILLLGVRGLERTKSESPCRTCEDESSRRIRETCLRFGGCNDGLEGDLSIGGAGLKFVRGPSEMGIFLAGRVFDRNFCVGNSGRRVGLVGSYWPNPAGSRLKVENLPKLQASLSAMFARRLYHPVTSDRRCT